MYFPKLNVLETQRDMIQTFKGYNHQLKIGDGEFYDMENLTSDYYPLIAPRNKRGKVVMNPSFTGGNMISKNRLWYQFGNTLNGYSPEDKSNAVISGTGLGDNTQFVSFGSYIVDMREKLWFSTIPNESGIYENGSFGYKIIPSQTYFSVYICDEEGNSLDVNHIGDTPPSSVSAGILWFDTHNTPGTLMRYFSEKQGWYEEPYYLRITYSSNDDIPIENGDFVRINAPHINEGEKTVAKICDLDQSHGVVLKGTNSSAGKNYFVIKAGIAGSPSYTVNGSSISVEGNQSSLLQSVGDISFENRIPEMDYVVESGNRLWGCRYGLNIDGSFVNEIYASKLGSFRVWEKFEGISDDSYMVSCGTDGPFTGAVSYGGYPIFFKEKAMHRVYGNYPFQVTPYTCNGVQNGCDKSLAVVNNILFYKSQTGICTYSGSVPQILELPFGGINYNRCIAAGTQTKYYFAMSDSEGKTDLFVYDTKTGILHKEDYLGISEMCSYGTEVYALVSGSFDGLYQKGIVNLTNRFFKNTYLEDDVTWFAETGIIGLSLPDKKYVTGLDIRMTAEHGSMVTIDVEYDSSGSFERLYTINGNGTQSFDIPVRVKRCDHLRMRISGKGNAKIFSITKTIENGSNK